MFGVFGVTGLIKSLAVNSLSLMETGPKILYSRGAGCGTLPNARSEAVGSRPNSIGLGPGPAQLWSDDLNPKSVGLSAQIHESR